MIHRIITTFNQIFGPEPFIVKSPGRVNLIGEHTDYNNGFVLPAAVDKSIYFAIAPNTLTQFRFYAIDLDESYVTQVDQIGICSVHWANYLLGVIAQFVKEGNVVSGFDCVFGGNVPLGAGMSSSAAIECGMAFAINHLEKYSYDRLQLAKFAQKAEHEYAGVQCGIMDQFASLYGKANQVIRLDCRSLEYELFPFNMTDYQLVLVNTGVKHALAFSEYNIRRQECEAGVHLLKKYYPEVASLRDANLEMIGEHLSELPADVVKRCSYVIEENQRVVKACFALQHQDFEAFGQLMYQSHEGLKNKFEVSCPELNHLVELASGIEGVIGSRMMGGGFGGCTINLIKKEAVTVFESMINLHYKTPDGNCPQITEVVIDQGTRLLSTPEFDF